MENQYTQLRQELDRKINDWLSVTPKVRLCPAFDPAGKHNIRAVTYDGASKGDLKTKVFAYIGYPEQVEEGDMLPAVVLIHGGCGHAFCDWVDAWNQRGYVAIAMDNTGFFPEKTTASGGDTVWRWGLDANPAFQEDGYTSVMQTDHYVTAGDPVESQWMYHAVVQAILAHNILSADPVVDSGKIGIMGISWGSLIAGMTIGYDKYAFAVLQYCAGYLNEAHTYMGAYSKNHAAYDDMWRAEDRWDNVDFPVLLLQWTGDYTATPNSNSRCYLHLKNAGAELSLIFDWFHGHDWSQEVSYYFANCAIAGKQAMTRAIDEPTGRKFRFRIAVPEDVQVTACLRYMKTALAYRPVDGEDPNQWYRDQRVSVNGTWVSGTVPADAVCYYIEFSNMVDGNCFYSATSVVSLDG